jgi:TRAP-type mannitol/chloroaromatic compound transport system substrate-binding protein
VGPYNDLALGFYQIAKNYYFPSFIEPGLATEAVVNKSKYKALPADLQEIIRTACQAEYDQVASDIYANDPRALETMVSKHGVKVHMFSDEILSAGAKASAEVLTGVRNSDNALAKKTAESFIAGLNLLRQRAEITDSPYLRAREKFFKLK